MEKRATGRLPARATACRSAGVASRRQRRSSNTLPTVR